jgi:hypothetical protein
MLARGIPNARFVALESRNNVILWAAAPLVVRFARFPRRADCAIPSGN